MATITGTYKRSNTKELVILLEKLKTIIGAWAAANGYTMEFSINVVDPVKTVKMTLTKLSLYEQNNFITIPETVGEEA